VNPTDPRLLRTFLAVADELNFTRAARRLHLTQQAVSAQVRALEAAVGVRLLERTTRSVTLTPAGKALRDGAVAGFGVLDDAVEQAREVGQGLRGVVRAGHTTGAGFRLVPAAVAELRRTAPGLELDSIQCMPIELAEAIRSGRLDLGIGLEIQDCGPGLRSQVVWTERWMVGIPPTDPLVRADTAAVRLADLTDRRWINWPRDTHPGYWDALHDLTAAAGFTPRVETARIGLADFLEAAATGAIHLLPASCRVHPLPGWVILPIEPAAPARYAAVWPADRPVPGLDQILTALTSVTPPD
jgi:DNA-binding transcriptional LysR family regulator